MAKEKSHASSSQVSAETGRREYAFLLLGLLSVPVHVVRVRQLES